MYNKKVIYEFLAGYKQNSGIFINNFFRNRGYKQYCEDKFHSFDFDVSGILPNVFDDMRFSFSMVGYMEKLEENKIAYFPIDINYILHLIEFSRALDSTTTVQEDMIVYRGCNSLARNGVSGLVSTTTDRRIAEQFSRGTILKIHVPKGTKYLNVKSIRPDEQKKGDRENEILLPPCDYQILSEQVVERGREPNHHGLTTRIIEITVTPKDILEEFAQMMETPPIEYEQVKSAQGPIYNEAIQALKKHLEAREKEKSACGSALK